MNAREKALILLNEAKKTVEESQGKIWGFEPVGENSIILTGEKLSSEERNAFLSKLPSFTNVYFLTGIAPQTYAEDPTLVQRVSFYGGTLPGWEWARGAGKWEHFYQECS
ncbi:MAG: hypothetical protein A3G49_01080 [Candidatus Sungbacteria bacterium RIFCSPLOWO2_12_FULL_41_11]|uniref:Uncharacterized protein n=1 Tax=Candidatus Sungbacteria bacterium RIFCSPLOWO2_12_FULL_41_11 TaxID=1802286 RepID=A0A1G2LP86_9BACT|nr:MAG: hypothetical protein UV01_C0006G0044 [Parcubacteria group bacterium GW2011_GWA2_42_14]OGZ97417.1 MAG: hypothetical protein A3D41_05630 [Candidatus Sungbacteria bacterium RIFCSPHIGHO2_02_FULL_41_12b]OHA13417.1 MAG: hypothetical protein A3G49_01080 [Candidatus Sungbacteria bacterium RIFCSPLOWO2_12_FULL_41_11]